MNYEQESRRRLQEDMKIATVMRRVMVVKNNNNFPTITEIFFFRFEILLEMHSIVLRGNSEKISFYSLSD